MLPSTLGFTSRCACFSTPRHCLQPHPLPTQVVCYRGDADAREEVWTRQLRGGRGGGAGGGTHVVLTTYDFLMNKNDK